jgi:hypothetical protein
MKECLSSPTHTWVKKHYRKGYYRKSGTHVKPGFVKAHCRAKYKTEAYWARKIKGTFPSPWINKEEKLAKWTEEELERLLEALNELPATFQKYDIQGIHRLKKSSQKGNPASNNLKSIVLYDEAFFITHNLSEVITHEMAHFLFQKLTMNQIDKFRLIANWDGNNLLRKNIIFPDSHINAEEDFCNVIQAYYYKKELLKKNSPALFSWIEKLLGGIK